MNDVTATLREVHEELVEKFVGREVENSILLRENMDLYFRFLPSEYLEKYGLRSVDPTEVKDPVARAENKAFNRSLKGKLFVRVPHGKNFHDLIPTFTRRVTIMNGNEITPHTYTSTVVPIATHYGYNNNTVCQLSNDGYSLNEFLNNAVVHLYDDETDDTPCPSSNICKLTDFSQGYGQYEMDFNVDDVNRGDDDDDKESYLLRVSIHKSIPNTAAYIHISVDFNLEVDNWTESHGDWKNRVDKSQLTYNGAGQRKMRKEQFNYLLENMNGQIEKVSIGISMQRVIRLL